MSKFNTTTARSARGNAFISSEKVASGTTYEGASGFARDQKSELFLLGVSNFVGENTFYEGASARDSRFASLARAVAVADPTWMTRFVTWLRREANMRSAALVAALEGAAGLLDSGMPGGRQLVAAALLRADEPGEALAYWHSKYGRTVPKPIKRGIADGATASYNEYSVGKYDTASKGYRFADVIQLTHPTPRDGRQADLFKFALDRRYDSSAEAPASLSILAARKELLALSGEEVRALASNGTLQDRLKAAGMTWEALSGVISGGMDSTAWEAVIPSMGYMALLRNLRNFQEKDVDRAVLKTVAKTLADPENVAESRQLPMRFLSAYRAVSNSNFFGQALEDALEASLQNVPSLSGKTLILVDRSGSMFWNQSERSDLNFADSAALFGSALAVRAENATLVEFGSLSREVKFKKSDSVLKMIERFGDLGGTSTSAAVARHFNNHDRVIILTDEQASGRYGGTPGSHIPKDVPLYNFNLVGYKYGSEASGPNRYTFGGLTDASFKTIEYVERSRNATWPWED